MIRRFSDQAISAGRGRSWTIRTGIAGLVVLRVLAVSPIVASASTVVYDVNLNFDPTTQEGGPGVGTVTGTFTIDTATDLNGDRSDREDQHKRHDRQLLRISGCHERDFQRSATEQHRLWC
jgi:hypothetical protein